jgi:DNA-binding NtrC family response regulator
MSRILVVDDEPALGENMVRLLHLPEVEVLSMTDPVAALESALASPPDVMFLDIRMPGLSGEEVFSRFHSAHPGVPVVFLTAFGSVEGAVLAMRNGAFDYLQKPFRREDLLLCTRRALEHRRATREVEDLRGRLEDLGHAETLETQNPLYRAELAKAAQAAASHATVLILGETGAGKEVVARWIHERSPRGQGPFVPIDCTSLPASLVESELFGHEKGAFTGASSTRTGLIESAAGGTLFLDEIGDLPVELQTRLFLFVEDRQVRKVGATESVSVDVRILCATNQDLGAKIKDGSFREELFYRLAVVTVRVPPLRERPEDLVALARFFLLRFCRRYGREVTASPAFYEALLKRPWRGNVRELRNTLERLVVLHAGDCLEPGDLGEDAAAGPSVEDLRGLPWKQARERYLEGFELAFAQSLLERCGGNVSAAAREAGVDRKTFYLMLHRAPGSRPGE